MTPTTPPPTTTAPSSIPTVFPTPVIATFTPSTQTPTLVPVVQDWILAYDSRCRVRCKKGYQGNGGTEWYICGQDTVLGTSVLSEASLECAPKPCRLPMELGFGMEPSTKVLLGRDGRVLDANDLPALDTVLLSEGRPTFQRP